MMTSQNVAGLQDRIRAAVQLHWKAFLIEGILLVVLGLGAIVVPPLASVAITIFLGSLLLISGVAGLALTFWARQMPVCVPKTFVRVDDVMELPKLAG